MLLIKEECRTTIQLHFFSLIQFNKKIERTTNEERSAATHERMTSTTNRSRSMVPYNVIAHVITYDNTCDRLPVGFHISSPALSIRLVTPNTLEAYTTYCTLRDGLVCIAYICQVVPPWSR